MADEEKFFDLEQAEKLLPTLEMLLETAQQNKLRTEAIEQEFTQMRNRILLYGGISPPYAYLAEKKLERDSYLTAIREAVARIEQAGCVLKDLDQGLVDFPSILNDEQVYLCWKRGEDRIRYWHRTDEGFAGRKPLNRGDLSSAERPKPN